MMMMMMISASALERHQPFDQRTIADIRLIVICILPRAFFQSVIHFQKIRANLFCLKINFSIMRVTSLIIYSIIEDVLLLRCGQIFFLCPLTFPSSSHSSFSARLTPLTSTLPFLSFFFFFQAFIHITNPYSSMFFLPQPMEMDEKDRVWVEERKKTILFTNKTMRTKDGRLFALTGIYLVVITAKREREKRGKKSRFSLFFFSLDASLSLFRPLFFSRRFFYLQALEAITTNRNIGTATAYNIFYTDIERPLAISFLSFARCLSVACFFFVSETFSSDSSFSSLLALRTRFESSGVCIALNIVRTHPQAVISCHFINFIIILPKIPGR